MATLLPPRSSSSSSRFARAACIAAGCLMLAGMFAANAWQPRSLFGAGEPGVAFDWTRKSLLYQDSARTTLVNAAGDPIGSASDISGNGNHASQSIAPSRPLWQLDHAEMDGADDGWVTPAIDFTGTDAVTIIASFRKLSDAGAGIVCELGQAWSFAGCFGLAAPQSGGANIGTGSRGSVFQNAVYANVSVAAPVTVVATAQARVSTDTLSLRLNAVQRASNAADQGTGNYTNNPLSIGFRNAGSGVFFNGWLYRMIVIGRLLTALELRRAETWAARPTGVVLP